MNSPQLELASALRERLAIISDAASRQDPERHLARLQAISQKINALAKDLPQPVDPQLAHYLARCSYDKALAALEAKL
jgi:hypothetical protein